MKRCYDCDQSKTLDNFPVNRRNRDGRGTSCRLCAQSRNRVNYWKKKGIPSGECPPESKTKRRIREAQTGLRLCSKCKSEKPISDFLKWVCGSCRRNKRLARYSANKQKYHDAHLKWKYGISRKELNKWIEAQDGKCAICEKERPLVVDHDHETEIVRGLLCRQCNHAIGLFYESELTLLNAANYLRIFKENLSTVPEELKKKMDKPF